jgi:hypothetical protein
MNPENISYKITPLPVSDRGSIEVNFLANSDGRSSERSVDEKMKNEFLGMACGKIDDAGGDDNSIENMMNETDKRNFPTNSYGRSPENSFSSALLSDEKMNFFLFDSPSATEENEDWEEDICESDDDDWISKLPVEHIIDMEDFVYESIEEYLEDEIEKISSTKFSKNMIDYISELLEIQIESIDGSELSDTYIKPTFEEIVEFVSNICEEFFFKDINIPFPPRSYPNTFTIEKTNEEISEISEKIKFLREQYQPKQRTPEWYEYRNKLLTASNIWKVFGSESQRNSIIYEKCKSYSAKFLSQATEDLSYGGNECIKTENNEEQQVDIGESVEDKNEFIGIECGKIVSDKDVKVIILEQNEKNVLALRSNNLSSPLHHGIKYEPLSAMIYEKKYDTKIGDFGCIVHPKHSMIGASPDGINIDIHSSRYGRMLEIKNISNRNIDGIPKEEYWVQMQIQMETCDLDECDFVETRFKEFESEEQFYEDILNCSTNSFCGSPEKMNIHRSEQDLLKPISLHSIPKNSCPTDEKINKIYEYRGVILYFIDKITTPNSMPHYVYLKPYDTNDIITLMESWKIDGLSRDSSGESVDENDFFGERPKGVRRKIEKMKKVKQQIDRDIELKIESFQKSEEGKNKILYEKIYWYLDEFSCVLVRRNQKWFEKVFPKILDVSKTIERERVEGFEHRASSRTKKTNSSTFFTETNVEVKN